MLWLPVMEAQAVPWTEVWISLQRTQNTLILTTKAHSSDATVALRGPEAVEHPKDLVYGNQHN